MNVVVCVEAGPVGEATRAALALAATLRGQKAAVIALSASASEGTETLAEACRLGADRAVQLVDPRLDGVDVDALGRALADAVRSLDATLVLAGARSDREGRGIVPAAVAHHLGAPYVPHIEELTIAGEREVEVMLRAGGRKRRLSVPLPALLTVGAAAPFSAGKKSSLPTPAIETLILEALPDETRPIRLYSLGSLDRPKRKPATAPTAVELVAQWLARS